MAFAVQVILLGLSATVMAQTTETKVNVLGQLIYNRTVRRIHCDNNDEYLYYGMCCPKCPAGTHVSEHCTENHKRGSCERCITGVGFTAGPNGLDACLNCHYCRPEDQIQVADCTPTSNYVCECKPGTYCIPNDNCDLYCSQCKSCAEGQREKHPCTAISDTECEEIKVTDSTMKFTDLWIIILLTVLGVAAVSSIVGAILCWRKQKGKEKPGGTGDTENPLLPNGSVGSTPEPGIINLPDPAQPARVRVRKLLAQEESIPLSQEDEEHIEICCGNISQAGDEDSHKPNTAESVHGCAQCNRGRSDIKCQRILTDHEWIQCYNCLKNTVLPGRWKEFMRCLGLADVEIEHITMDHSDSREKNYQMFILWRNQTGQQASMQTVFRVLDEMNLGGCRENVANTLQSQGIHIA